MWTVACQTPPSLGFPRQEYWSGLLFPSPGDLPDPGKIEPMCPVSPALQVDSLPTKTSGKTWEFSKQHKGSCSSSKHIAVLLELEGC